MATLSVHLAKHGENMVEKNQINYFYFDEIIFFDRRKITADVI